MWFVYILLCDDKMYYTGMTSDIASRLEKHKSGESIFTKQFKKIELVYKEQLKNKTEVAKRERQIKGWSNNKKRMLVEGTLGLY